MDRREFLASALSTGALLVSGCDEILMPSKKAAVGAPQSLQLGPFKGVWDSTDPMDQLEKYLKAAVNMQFVDAQNGGGVAMRHGFMGRTTQYGDSSHRIGQCVFLHRGIDGTIYNYQFTGGKMYTWAGNDTDHTLLSPSVTIDKANRIFCVSYNGLLIVSDEVNPPWVWDPVALTSTVINVDSVPSAWNTKGGPVIYGGKVFFAIRSIGGTSFRNAITWCEELTPLVGYKQTGFNDYWQLLQTGTDVIGGIVAEEAGFVYLRNEGIGVITGTVNSDFKANATRDTVSSTVGTDCPAAIVQYNNWIYFLDMDGRPYRMQVGGGDPQPLWYPMRRIIEARTANATNPASRAAVATNGSGMYHEKYKLVLFTIWDKVTLYGFDAETGNFVGQWLVAAYPFLDDIATLVTGPPYQYAGFFIDAMGSLQEANKQPAMCMIGDFEPGASPPSPSVFPGVFWRQKGLSDYAPWYDQYDASSNVLSTLRGTTPTHRVETRDIRGNAMSTVRLVSVAASVSSRGNTSTTPGPSHRTELAYQTPASFAPNLATWIAAFAPGTGADQSNQDATSVAKWSGFTPNAQGAWLRLLLGPYDANLNGGDIEPDLAYRWAIYEATIEYLVTRARPSTVYP